MPRRWWKASEFFVAHDVRSVSFDRQAVGVAEIWPWQFPFEIGRGFEILAEQT
jgi:hypothetical protein